MINCIPDTDLTNACLEKIESESSLEQLEHWPIDDGTQCSWSRSNPSRPSSRSNTGLDDGTQCSWSRSNPSCPWSRSNPNTGLDDGTQCGWSRSNPSCPWRCKVRGWFQRCYSENKPNLTELLVYRVGCRARVAEWKSGRVECTGKG